MLSFKELPDAQYPAHLNQIMTEMSKAAREAYLKMEQAALAQGDRKKAKLAKRLYEGTFPQDRTTPHNSEVPLTQRLLATTGVVSLVAGSALALYLSLEKDAGDSLVKFLNGIGLHFPIGDKDRYTTRSTSVPPTEVPATKVPPTEAPSESTVLDFDFNPLTIEQDLKTVIPSTYNLITSNEGSVALFNYERNVNGRLTPDLAAAVPVAGGVMVVRCDTGFSKEDLSCLAHAVKFGPGNLITPEGEDLRMKLILGSDGGILGVSILNSKGVNICDTTNFSQAEIRDVAFQAGIDPTPTAPAPEVRSTVFNIEDIKVGNQEFALATDASGKPVEIRMNGEVFPVEIAGSYGGISVMAASEITDTKDMNTWRGRPDEFAEGVAGWMALRWAVESGWIIQQYPDTRYDEAFSPGALTRKLKSMTEIDRSKMYDLIVTAYLSSNQNIKSIYVVFDLSGRPSVGVDAKTSDGNILVQISYKDLAARKAVISGGQSSYTPLEAAVALSGPIFNDMLVERDYRTGLPNYTGLFTSLVPQGRRMSYHDIQASINPRHKPWHG